MFDPMSFGFLATALAQNPELAGQLDQMGIPSPTGGGGVSFPTSGLGANLMPGTAVADPTAAGGGQAPGGAPAGAPATPGAPDTMQLLQSLKGIQVPKPVTPIMQGGVAGGGQKAPVVQTGGGPSMAIQSLLQQAMGTQAGNPLRVPALGAMLRGGKY